MIYEYPSEDAPLRQGDIFLALPRVNMSLKHVPVMTPESEQLDMSWEEIVRKGEPVAAVLVVKAVAAILATQDCDASRAPDITLCEIRAFREVEGKARDAKRPRGWMKIITQHARLNQKWFYLPPDSRVGFDKKMAADFFLTIRVPREDLEHMRHLRHGRLNPVASAHFRERIAEFFRRYAYNEWYPLTPGEMEEYGKDYPDALPYPWQIVPRPAGE